ncbi:hypothetical protein HYS50_00685 [Candidatus Woesearchaeota archaeon]|nr:hypothetical protein [Candidatus Woesearchaeota archaeon]
MKKIVIIVLLLFILSPVAFAKIDSIYEYLQRVDKNFKIVLGAKAKGGDSLAAIDVALGLKRYNVNEPDLETVIEDEVAPKESKIVIGHPCDNGLVPISCEAWPYRKGEAIIRVIGNDLIIAGSSLDDTRRAAKVIGSYKAYDVLKETTSIVVTASGFGGINATKEKSQDELICGDGVCEPGERFCFSDCADMTCSDVCQEEGYDEAACRDQKSNPNVPSCLAEEYSKGLGYCATGKVCCCKKAVSPEKTQLLERPPEKLILWQKIILFLKRLFRFA